MHSRRSSSRWSARLLTLAVWALVAGSAVFWALQRPPRLAAGGGMDDAVALAGSVDVQRVARALGAAGVQAPQAAARATVGQLRLLGVITQGAGGAVLVSVDDASAHPVRVGQAPAGLDGRWVLQSVAPHSAVFADGDEQVELHMPPMDERSRAGDAVAPGPDARDPASAAAAAVDAASRRALERRARLLQRAGERGE